MHQTLTSIFTTYLVKSIFGKKKRNQTQAPFLVKLQAMMLKSEHRWKVGTPKNFISKCFFKTSSSKIYSK